MPYLLPKIFIKYMKGTAVKMKKLCLCLAALCIAFSLMLVGCGSKKDDSANTTSQGSTSSLSEGASSAISSAESRFDMDDKSDTTASSSSETGSSASSSQTVQ